MTDTGQVSFAHSDTDSQGEIFLAPFFKTVWRYRRVIGMGLAATLAGFVALAVVLRLALPSEQFGAISFRVDMEGASKGEYPNGSKFSSEEIIATPVLTEVYQTNDLKRYGEFKDVVSGFLVENSSDQRDAIAREYQAKLSDTRVTPVDRTRLEAEFQDKLNALNTPEYRVSYRQKSIGQQLPSLLVNKVLQDTLRTWARFASERNGALSYNIPVLSRNVLRWDDISRQDYLPGLDILRLHLMRVMDTLDLFRNKVPGADAVRVGEKQMTLEEIKSSLESLQLNIDMLSSVATAGVSKDPALLRVYVDDQSQQMRLKRDEANRRVAGLEQALQQYSQQFVGSQSSSAQPPPAAGFPRGQAGNETLIPQFSESFLDRLMQMSSRKEEVTYRQGLIDRLIAERFQAAKLEHEVAHYEALSRSLSTAHMPAGASAQAATIEARMKSAFDELGSAMDHVVALHDQLAKNNLNPSTLLYTVTHPYTQERLTPLTVRVAILWGVALLIVAFFVLVLAVLIHDRFHPANRRMAHTRRDEPVGV